MLTRRLLLAMAIGSTITLHSAVAQERPGYYPKDYDATVEASRGENGILLYSNSSTDDWKPVFDDFNELYPWIRINNLDLASAELIERYLAERGTNTATADLLVSGAADGFLRMIDRGEIADYTSPESPHIPEFARPVPGLYTIAIDPLLLVTNKLTVPENLVPTGVRDLAEKAAANPQIFGGKIATYNAETNAYGFVSGYMLTKHYGDEAWKWLDTIGANSRLENSVGPMLEKLIAGEYNVALFAASGGTWLRARDPQLERIVRWSFIDDGNPALIRGLALPKGATNVNSAKLLIDYLLSERGQIELAKAARTPVRIGLSREDTGGYETYASIVDLIGEDKFMSANYDAEIFSARDTFIPRWKAAFGR